MKSLARKTFSQYQTRGFATTVTINMPKFELYKLEESKMPKTATTNK